MAFDRVVVVMNTRTEATEQNKATLIAAMKEHGINYIHVSFDGCGDSGQMEEVVLFNEKAEQIDDDCLDRSCEVIHTSQTYKDNAWHHEKFSRMETIRDLAETVAYWPLEDHFGGWEINEGAYGTVVINADGTGTIDYNQRVVDIETDSASF